MEKMGCKCLILKTWDCRGGVSWSNGGGFSLWGMKNVAFSRLEMPLQ